MSSTQLAAAVYQVFYSLIRLFFFFLNLYAIPMLAIYFKLTSLEVFSPASVHARRMQAAKEARRLRVPASLVVHCIGAPPSSEWSSRKARTRADSSTPARSPGRISATSLR